MRLWDLESGAELRRFEGHKDWIPALALMPDGRRAVSASEDQTVRLWDLERGTELASFHSDGRLFSCAAGGEHVVVGDDLGRFTY